MHPTLPDVYFIVEHKSGDGMDIPPDSADLGSGARRSRRDHAAARAGHLEHDVPAPAPTQSPDVRRWFDVRGFGTNLAVGWLESPTDVEGGYRILRIDTSLLEP
jgi:hypothetical protein